MTIKQQGGIFGRNPTFNNVAVDGTLTVDQIVEKTAAAGISLDGVTLKDGNVVLANGKGIDFSATSGTGTSELFSDYEEGTWTPAFRGAVTLPTIDYAQYTKIGRVCFYELRLTIPATTDGAAFEWSLPFTRASTSGGDGACITYSNKDATYNHSVGAGFSNVYHRIYSKSGASLTYLNYSSSILSVSGSFIAA